MHAAELFSEELITWDCYDEVNDSSSKSDKEKAASLMKALMTTISSQPAAESVRGIIGALERVEVFQSIVKQMKREMS